MKTIIKVTCAALAIMVFANGCMSYAVYKGSQRKVAERKALASGNEAAVKAIRLGDDGVGVGIDVTNLEALTERPWLQLGAALLDAAIVYGTKEAVDSLNSKEDDSNNAGAGSVNISVSGSDDTTINVNTERDTTTTSTDNSDNSNRSENN